MRYYPRLVQLWPAAQLMQLLKRVRNLALRQLMQQPGDYPILALTGAWCKWHEGLLPIPQTHLCLEMSMALCIHLLEDHLTQALAFRWVA